SRSRSRSSTDIRLSTRTARGSPLTVMVMSVAYALSITGTPYPGHQPLLTPPPRGVKIPVCRWAGCGRPNDTRGRRRCPHGERVDRLEHQLTDAARLKMKMGLRLKAWGGLAGRKSR